MTTRLRAAPEKPLGLAMFRPVYRTEDGTDDQ